MNPAQIEFAAIQVCRKYFHLTVPEIKSCLENGVSGDYGIIYDRMDLSVLMDWLAKFDQERNAACAVIHDYETHNNNIYDLVKNDTMHGIVKDVVQKLEHKKVAEVKLPIRELTENQIKKNEFDEMIHRSWDNHLLRQANGKKGLADRFTKEQFIEYKYSQLLRVDEYLKSK